jgi:hypothetical protein
VFAPALSGTYVANTAFVPTGSDPPGIVMLVLPFTSVPGVDVYAPHPWSVTEPVGVGLPFPPATVAVNVSGSVEAILGNCGVKVSVGVISAVDVTVTEPRPVL